MWLSYYTFMAVCWVVISRGVIGSLVDRQEECAACIKGSCRNINGIYTRLDLPPEYSFVAQIPEGACNVLVQQMKRTKNLIALKHSNGSFIMNGDWKFSNSGQFRAAGTKFMYVRQSDDFLETLSSPGPLAGFIDIMVVNYQPNLGIKYGYSLPMAPDITPPSKKQTTIEPYAIGTKHLNTDLNTTLQKDDAKTITIHRRPRIRRTHFRWKITGLTACSKSCGGGIQAYVRTCVREVSPHNQVPVHERRCSHLDFTATSPIQCNTEPCPPSWQVHWTQCSVTCGEGLQRLIPQCQQIGDIQVSENLCLNPKPTVQIRTCQERFCDYPNDNKLEHPVHTDKDVWSVGGWSQCSVSCGMGHRTRSVTCLSNRCRSVDRPAHTEYCNRGSCAPLFPPLSLSQTSQLLTSWLTTEWSQCSESCGTGNQTRFAVCEAGEQSRCSDDSKPNLARACSSDKHCGGQWFVGSWSTCSDSCTGRSKQQREVLCVVKIRGLSHITYEMTCTAHIKPVEEQFCEGVCPPHWYAGDWSACEGSCPTGVQRRQITCLDIQGRPSEECTEDNVPIAKRTCVCRNKIDRDIGERYQPAQDEPINRTCADRIRQCKVAVQARLCHYPYYINHCCESCKGAQDLLE